MHAKAVPAAPRPRDDEAFLYCLGLAAGRARMKVVGFIAQANHHHAIVVDVEGRMPEFLEGFHKLVAKHQNALRGRWENFWASEATSANRARTGPLRSRPGI